MHWNFFQFGSTHAEPITEMSGKRSRKPIIQLDFIMWDPQAVSAAGHIFPKFWFKFFSAAGLYYLAELIEEYTVATGRLIKYIIYVSIHYKC